MDLSRPPRPGAATEPPMRHCEAIRTKTRAATPPWRRNQGSVEKHSGPRVGWCIRWGSLPDGYIGRTEPHRHCRQARNTLQAAAGGSRGPRTRVSRGLRPRPPPRAPNAGNHSIQSVGYVAGSNAHKSRGHGNPVSANHPFFWPRGHIRKPGGGSTEPGRVGWGVQCFTRNGWDLADAPDALDPLPQQFAQRQAHQPQEKERLRRPSSPPGASDSQPGADQAPDPAGARTRT